MIIKTCKNVSNLVDPRGDVANLDTFFGHNFNNDLRQRSRSSGKRCHHKQKSVMPNRLSQTSVMRRPMGILRSCSDIEYFFMIKKQA
jgi:hypothetical protein